jgi:hypothetical protein
MVLDTTNQFYQTVDLEPVQGRRTTRVPARTTKVRNGGGGGGGSRVTCALAMSTDMENCVFAAKNLAIGECGRAVGTSVRGLTRR